jgi:hypothetical protein
MIKNKKLTINEESKSEQAKQSNKIDEEFKELCKKQSVDEERVKLPVVELLYEKIMKEQVEFILAAEIVLVVRELQNMRDKFLVSSI